MSITLSKGLPEGFADSFSGEFYHLLSQQKSLYENTVRTEPILGAEDKAFNMLGGLELVAKTEVHAPTPQATPNYGKRWVSTAPWHQAVCFDKDEDLSLITSPKSDVQQELMYAVNRRKNAIIRGALDANVTSGRRAGETITWASMNGNVKYTDTSGGRTIAHDTSEGNCIATDTGMTVEKIELIQEYFAMNQLPEEIAIFCAVPPRIATQLFGQIEYTNYDYNTGKPLATGRMLKNWHGINWILDPAVKKGTANDVDGDTAVYKCWAWAQNAIILGVQAGVSTEMSILPTQSYDQQIYVHINMGAMRMDEDKVCVVECQ